MKKAILTLILISMASLLRARASASDLSSEFYFYRMNKETRYADVTGVTEAKDFNLLQAQAAIREQNQILAYAKCKNNVLAVLVDIPNREFVRSLGHGEIEGPSTQTVLKLYQGDQSRPLRTIPLSTINKFNESATHKLRFSDNCDYLVDNSYPHTPWVLNLRENTGFRTLNFGENSSLSMLETGSANLAYAVVTNYKTGDTLKRIHLDTGVIDTLFTYPKNILVDALSIENNEPITIGQVREGVKHLLQIDGAGHVSVIPVEPQLMDKLLYGGMQPLSSELLAIDIGEQGSHLHTVFLINTKTGRVERSIHGVGNFRRMSDSLASFTKQEGSDELSPYVLDLKSGVQTGLAPHDIFGQFVNPVADEHRILSAFHSSFMNSVLFELSPGQPAKEIFSTNSLGRNVHGSRGLVHGSDGFMAPIYIFANRPLNQIKGVVIYVHGGGCHVNYFYDVADSDPLYSEVVNAGYALVGVDYRNDVISSPEYTPKNWNKETCGTQDVEDILSARAYIDRKFPNQPIFLWGHSQGGYLVNLIATRYAERAKWAGIISGAGMWTMSNNSEMPTFMKDYYNTQALPLDYIKNLKAPFLLFHGQADKNVSVNHAVRFLKSFGVQIDEQKVFENELLPERYKIASPAIEAYLPVGEEHHLGNAEKYSAWVEMFKNFLERNR